MNKMRLPVLLTVLVSLLQFEQMSLAAVIRSVSVQAVYSEFTNGTDQRRATNTLNGSGLFGDFHTVQAQGSMWLTGPGSPPAGDYTNAFVTFDLGAIHTLDQMKVWNYNETAANTGRGIQRADIYTSTDGVNFTTNFSNVLFNRAPGAFTNFAQSISLGGISARYIGFKVLTNYNGADARVGLSKVLFFDTNVAPVITFASRNFSNDRVTVLFSDHVSPATATNVSNYSILLSGTNAATISSAAFDFYPNRVVLQTSVLNSNFVYSVRATNVTDAVNGVKVDATPVPIEAELSLWLKADAGVTTNATDEFVNQWNDQSGSSNHAVQIQAGLQPLLVANAINGRPVLRFDGSGANINYLEIAHASDLVIRSDFSVFAVINAQSLVGYNAIITKTAVNQPAPMDFYTLINTGSPRLFRGNGSANNQVVGLSNVVTGQSYILSGIARGTNLTAYLNGAFNGTALATAGITDTGGAMMVGTRADLFTKMVGDIAEIILIRGAVSDAERAAINSYLGGKYGITVVNLAFAQQPTNTTRLEGQTATFSVAVTASSPNVGYQWQRYGTNLPSATNASYTTPTLTLADNNSTFRVQVSIPGSSQFSDTATLTVLADTEAPTVVSAGRRIWSTSEVVVVFSEPMSPGTAANSANYTLNNGGSVTAAVVGENSRQIVLTTSGLTNGGSYMLTVQNARDLFNNSVVTTQVPLTAYPAAALWLSASSAMADENGYVTNWFDLSGNGNNAAPTFGAPFTAQIITNGFNGQPVARFDGVDSVSLFVNTSPSLEIIGDMTIYAVASFVDYVNFNSFVGKTAVNLPASYDFYLVSGSGLPRFYRGDGGANLAQVTGTLAPSLGVPHVVSVVMEGTSVAHFLDGEANGNGTLAAIMADTAQPVGIGTRNDGVTKLKGDLAEIFIFGSALSPADRTALDNYFGAKYGIQVGTLPSVSITRASGGTVVLSWPTPAQPFTLQSATNIVSAPWEVVTNSVSSGGGTDSVTVEATGNQQFYRLQKQ